MKKLNKNDIATESDVGLSLSGFMGTLSLFFTGILISQINNFGNSIKVPIIYLVISTFSFLFSAVIYANITGIITANKLLKAEKYLLTGNSLSEFLGLYLFVISIPMVIISITNDGFLRQAISAVSLISIFLYSISQFSLFKRSFSKPVDIFFSISVLVLSGSAYFTQLNYESIFPYLSVALIIVLIVSALFSNELKIRR